MSNALTIRIYPDRHWVYNIVHPDDLESHIKYNRDFRPGCIFYVDGVRKSNGCRKEEYLKEFDILEEKIRHELLGKSNLNMITRPYR